MDKSSFADKLDVRQIGFFAVQPLERSLHVKPGVKHTVLEIIRREYELPSHLGGESAVDKKESNHNAERLADALGQVNLLRLVGCRKHICGVRL